MDRTEMLFALRARMAEYLEAHPDNGRDTLLAQLRWMRAKLAAEDREEAEDLVLDLMDILTGWVRSELQL